MAASMKDVARVAGVSIKTVSNVVNDYPFVSAETRARVRAALDLLDYRPNTSARGLRTGRTDLIALAKKKPGELSYGTSGIGGGGHLAAELLQASTGIQLVHVPYKGGAQASTDLQGGQIPLLFSSMPTAVPTSGEPSAIVSMTLKRAPPVRNRRRSRYRSGTSCRGSFPPPRDGNPI